MHVSGQNAGLLVTRVDTEILYESLELLAPDGIATGCRGRLRRCFPTHTVAVSQSHVEDVTFQQPFVKVLAQLSAHEEKPRPSLVTEMVMGVLRGIGRIVPNASYISKNSREESRHDNYLSRSTSWCRSPLWLLIRVALQLTLDRAGNQDGRSGGHHHKLYKAFMVFLLSTILERAAQEHVSHDMLFFMKAKISRRLLKFGLVEGEDWYSFPLEVIRHVDSTITNNWDSAQSPERQFLDLSGLPKLDFSQDTLLNLTTLQSHLAQIPGRKKPENPKDDRIHSLPFRRIQDTTPNIKFSHDKDVTFFELADFERWVESRAKHRMLNGRMFTTAKSQGEEREANTTRNQSKTIKVGTDMRVLQGFMSKIDKDENKELQENKWLQKGSKWFQKDSKRLRKDSKQLQKDSKWLHFVDNAFAQKFRPRMETPSVFLPVNQPLPLEQQQPLSQLCDECKVISVLDHDFGLFLRPRSLKERSERCQLCGMLYQALWPSGAAHLVRPVRVYRKGTNLWADGYDQPILRMCVDPEWRGDGALQVGWQTPLERSSTAYLELLLEWLRDCDSGHKGFERHKDLEQYQNFERHEDFECTDSSEHATDFECCKGLQTPRLPTRVIDVGHPGKSKGAILRLFCTKKWDRGRYIALSHRWGEQNDEERARNRTLKSNIKDRCQGIDLAMLGKTFQDAITVTRGLGLRYLWIDSLCIVQDDKDDWEREAKCMGTVFSSAYCVVAAAAAKETRDGFLGPWPPARFVTLSNPSGPLYLCESVDNFHGDVENASLSKRGWVLQERALAQRTIFFSKNQIYWECGRGVRCESGALLKR